MRSHRGASSVLRSQQHDRYVRYDYIPSSRWYNIGLGHCRLQKYQKCIRPDLNWEVAIYMVHSVYMFIVIVFSSQFVQFSMQVAQCHCYERGLRQFWLCNMTFLCNIYPRNHIQYCMFMKVNAVYVSNINIDRRLYHNGCPIIMLAILNQYESINVWGVVTAFIRLPRMFLSTVFL